MSEFEFEEGIIPDEPEVNADPRLPCVLLLDVSTSMRGEKIEQLNMGVKVFEDAIKADSKASRRVEVSIVTFGISVDIKQDFVAASEFTAPVLKANGSTPMGEAILKGYEVLGKRLEMLEEEGIPLYKPWLVLITDGGPTDSWQDAANKVRESEEKKRSSFWAIGVENANMKLLAKIAPPQKPPAKLNEFDFTEFFKWLSESLRAVSGSTPGQQVPLPSPAWMHTSA